MGVKNKLKRLEEDEGVEQEFEFIFYLLFSCFSLQV
jgi:hypothetical protein